MQEGIDLLLEALAIDGKFRGRTQHPALVCWDAWVTPVMFEDASVVPVEAS
jgi:hypothetical protein